MDKNRANDYDSKLQQPIYFVSDQIATGNSGEGMVALDCVEHSEAVSEVLCYIASLVFSKMNSLLETSHPDLLKGR